MIGARTVWGPELEHAGAGIRIGIIDDGIDPSHPYFDASGLAMPEGFPKGEASFTTAKVIVARAFPPPDAKWRNAGRPFDPVHSEHGTHVAGIAAGDADTVVPASAGQEARRISGVAPLAYLGNYKALTIPTESGVGLDGNSPEIVAAIEAAVEDGMDVLNLSLGEPEVDPARDAVAKALDNAAAAGVVPVVAAGNDFAELGAGSVGSPGSSARAITVAATTLDRNVATFSARGPTPLGLMPKPDVSAPGVSILSALPEGDFAELSGTSMATPMVAGAAALLRQLHPGWTVSELKSALVTTGRPVGRGRGAPEVSPARQGGGLVDLPAAADPLLHASPQSLGFGLLDVSDGARTATGTLAVSDAGGGAGTWAISVETQQAEDGVTLGVPALLEVPGDLPVSVAAAADARPGERSGFVVLERDGERRRVPFWLRVTRPALPDEEARLLPGAGTYRGNTRGRPARVSRYRYPEPPSDVVPALAGPERVFRIHVERPVANLGVAVVDAARGVLVEPRVVRDRDENRLVGATSLPFVANPYLPTFMLPAASAAALLPAPGEYTLVFDESGTRGAGRFSFRVWVDDVTPPTVRLLSRVARSGALRVRVTDRGSGVDPDGVWYRVGRGSWQAGRLDQQRGVAILDVGDRRPGRHRLRVRVWDRQETKNNENVARILPNTRRVETTFTVPRGSRAG